MNKDEAYEFLINKIIDILDKTTKERSQKINNKYIPHNIWMSKGISVPPKRKLYLQYKGLHHNTQAYQKYIKYCNVYNKVIKGAKPLYYNKQFQKNKGDIKKPGKL